MQRDRICIGASAGGLEVLLRIVADFPADWQASVFVVLHSSPTSPGILPQVLGRVTSLTVEYARQGERIRPGRIYVAPPDDHLLVRQGYLELGHGAKENGFRPAVDPLFRSAAFSYGPRVIGAVLSGGLNDGAFGVQIIHSRQGLVVVQDPGEALVPSMPMSAIRATEGDHVVPSALLGGLLVDLSQQQHPDDDPPLSKHAQAKSSGETAGEEFESPLSIPEMPGAPSPFTCPECGGALWELEHGALVRFRCHVGHAFSSEVLESLQTEGLEHALWSAVRALEEQAELQRRIARRMYSTGMTLIASDYQERSAATEQRAATIRSILTRPRSGQRASAEPGAS